MKIVIVGDGKVGSTIANQLSLEGHDVIVIDNNAAVLTNSGNTMDIFCIEGNGATASVLKEAGIQQTDVLIAATSAATFSEKPLGALSPVPTAVPPRASS